MRNTIGRGGFMSRQATLKTVRTIQRVLDSLKAKDLIERVGKKYSI